MFRFAQNFIKVSPLLRNYYVCNHRATVRYLILCFLCYCFFLNSIVFKSTIAVVFDFQGLYAFILCFVQPSHLWLSFPRSILPRYLLHTETCVCPGSTPIKLIDWMPPLPQTKLSFNTNFLVLMPTST